MTGTGVDVNRYGTPDGLQQPQTGIAPQGVCCSYAAWSSCELGKALLWKFNDVISLEFANLICCPMFSASVFPP